MGKVAAKFHGNKMGFSISAGGAAAHGTLSLHDAGGVAGAAPDAPPTYTASPAFLTLTASADGMSVDAVVDPASSPVAGDVVVTAHCVGGGTAFDVAAEPLTLAPGPAAGGALIFVE